MPTGCSLEISGYGGRLFTAWSHSSFQAQLPGPCLPHTLAMLLNWLSLGLLSFVSLPATGCSQLTKSMHPSIFKRHLFFKVCPTTLSCSLSFAPTALCTDPYADTCHTALQQPARLLTAFWSHWKETAPDE